MLDSVIYLFFTKIIYSGQNLTQKESIHPAQQNNLTFLDMLKLPVHHPGLTCHDFTSTKVIVFVLLLLFSCFIERPTIVEVG